MKLDKKKIFETGCLLTGISTLISLVWLFLTFQLTPTQSIPVLLISILFFIPFSLHYKLTKADVICFVFATLFLFTGVFLMYLKIIPALNFAPFILIPTAFFYPSFLAIKEHFLEQKKIQELNQPYQCIRNANFNDII